MKATSQTFQLTMAFNDCLIMAKLEILLRRLMSSNSSFGREDRQGGMRS